jgi:hypothetical protein
MILSSLPAHNMGPQYSHTPWIKRPGSGQDVEPEAHESRSRAAEGEEDGSYVRDGAGYDDTPAKRAPKRAVNLTLARRASPG